MDYRLLFLNAAVFVLPVLGGILSLCFCRVPRNASRIGSGTLILSSLALLVLTGHSLTCGADRNIVFLISIALVGLAAAIHAPSYLAGHAGKVRTGVFWLLFGLTQSAMTMAALQYAFIPFLLAWEVMGLASLGLVMFDYESRTSTRAAWIYALACEAGGLCLMLFYRMQSANAAPELLFLLAALGFGLKAGFPLLHVWLPEAHPAAPAPVSALMSGAMIPLGFCGLFRFAPCTGTFAGWFLLICGLVGALGGILCALPAKNLKRLLAYSSVENIGIISMGFGIGLLGTGPLAGCGYAGALLHIVNHALLKGTLFLGAGAVLRSAGTLEIDRLGGLHQKMPKTAGLFALAAAGICGLPPFAGFTGELLIYVALFNGLAVGTGAFRIACFIGLIVLAMTGAAACAAFVKAYSGTFAGAPRSEAAEKAVPEKRGMIAGMLLLSLPAWAMPFLAPLFLPVHGILSGNAVFAVILLLFFCWFRLLTRKTDRRTLGTWDCGYAAPSARMEYTGTALIQPLADLFAGFLHFRRHIHPVSGGFPEHASADAESDDAGFRFCWRPLFLFINWIAVQTHHFQSGYLHLYILIMVLALALLLGAGFLPWKELLP